MKRLVFDIEMVAEDFDSFDEETQSNLTRRLQQSGLSDEKYAVELENLKHDLVFSPLTSRIIAIGVYDVEEQRGAVYYDAADTKPDEIDEDGIKYVAMSEADMLMKFWTLAEVADEFISFYGRGSDVPFLMVRSAIHGIRPTKDLMSNRYNSSKLSGAVHWDLYDLLTFYGASRKGGSLHMWCRAFKIESPKMQMDGADVGPAYKDGKYLDIAKYNAADLRATAQLYAYWHRYLKF